jgi:hypothetical protein
LRIIKPRSEADLERDNLVELILLHKTEYLVYRGSSFDSDGNLLWAKDDAGAYAEALDYVVNLIDSRKGI